MIPGNNAADTAEFCLFVCFLSFSWKKWFMLFFFLKGKHDKACGYRVKTTKPRVQSPGSRGSWGKLVH